MKQQIVIPSGANQLSENPCCSSGKYYAYASTLSVYVYRSEDMQLERIINYPENTILCIAGNQNVEKVSEGRPSKPGPDSRHDRGNPPAAFGTRIKSGEMGASWVGPFAFG